MVFQFKPNSRINVPAQVAGEICEELSQTVGLTPKTLLDASRAEDAALHDYFEWNDEIAADKYRESQAGYMIRMLIVRPEETETAVRAFISINQSDRSGGTYKPLDVVIRDGQCREEMLCAAMREMDMFKNKYHALIELLPIFKAYESVKAQ